MFQNRKMVIPGLVLVLALGGFTLVHAATKPANGTAKSPAAPTATATTKPAAKPAAVPQPKLSQDQATQIALAAHKGATLIEAKQIVENGKPFYVVKLNTPKGTRELKIGGNSGKIFKDLLTAAAKATK